MARSQCAVNFQNTVLSTSNKRPSLHDCYPIHFKIIFVKKTNVADPYCFMPFIHFRTKNTAETHVTLTFDKM